MSWDQLLEIQREARKRRVEEVSRPLVACPDDGTPLEDGPRASFIAGSVAGRTGPGPITKKEGKWDFFLVGEIADDDFANRYLKCGRSKPECGVGHQGWSAGAPRAVPRTGRSGPLLSVAST